MADDEFGFSDDLFADFDLEAAVATAAAAPTKAAPCSAGRRPSVPARASAGRLSTLSDLAGHSEGSIGGSESDSDLPGSDPAEIDKLIADVQAAAAAAALVAPAREAAHDVGAPVGGGACGEPAGSAGPSTATATAAAVAAAAGKRPVCEPSGPPLAAAAAGGGADSDRSEGGPDEPPVAVARKRRRKLPGWMATDFVPPPPTPLTVAAADIVYVGDWEACELLCVRLLAAVEAEAEPPALGFDIEWRVPDRHSRHCHFAEGGACVRVFFCVYGVYVCGRGGGGVYVVCVTVYVCIRGGLASGPWCPTCSTR